MNPDLERLSDLGPILYLRPLHLLLGQNVEVDLGAFEQALVELCQDDRRRAVLSAQATARARAIYDWRVVVRGYEAVWTELSARPWQRVAPTPPHPARLDFGAVFADYPTDVIRADRAVVRSALSRALCTSSNGYFIYPELRHVFEGDAVLAALGLAEAPTTVAALSQGLSARFGPGESWRAGALIAWLLKHGLLENVQ